MIAVFVDHGDRVRAAVVVAADNGMADNGRAHPDGNAFPPMALFVSGRCGCAGKSHQADRNEKHSKCLFHFFLLFSCFQFTRDKMPVNPGIPRAG
jgi:hypothetical protein